MTDEKPSVLAPYEGLLPKPVQETDPERFRQAEELADRIIQRIQNTVNDVGVVRARFTHSQMDRLIDALKWHLPGKTLKLLKIDEKLKHLADDERAVKRGQVAIYKGREIQNKKDRQWVLDGIAQDVEMLETMRTYIMGLMSFGIRGWTMGRNDQKMLDAVSTMTLVFGAMAAEGAEFLGLKLYRIEKVSDPSILDAQGRPTVREVEVPFDSPIFGSPK